MGDFFKSKRSSMGEFFKSEITIEFLKELGFSRIGRTEHYFLRISDDVALAYDTNYGFMEVRRHVDGRKRHGELMICLPKPYRTEKDFKEFIKAIVP
jgi:hypothetical protein